MFPPDAWPGQYLCPNDLPRARCCCVSRPGFSLNKARGFSFSTILPFSGDQATEDLLAGLFLDHFPVDDPAQDLLDDLLNGTNSLTVTPAFASYSQMRLAVTSSMPSFFR